MTNNQKLMLLSKCKVSDSQKKTIIKNKEQLGYYVA